jgi:four helix bundle protein
MTGERPTSNVQRPTSNESGAARHRAYDLEERLLNYAVRIIRLVDTAKATLGGKTIAGQLVRSGTSPTLHHGEVQAAESPADFIHKLSVCLKELRETRRALLVMERVPLTTELAEIRSLVDETEQLVRIFATSIKTTKARTLTHSARVREDSPILDEGSARVCEDSEAVAVDHWTLDVGCWTLDVLAAALKEIEGGAK